MFFDNCDCEKLDLSKSVNVTDSLNHFSISVPDSTWKPVRFLSKNENGLTVGDTTKGFLRLINITEQEYNGLWNWDKEQKSVEKTFNVKETGDLNFNGKVCRWNLVSFDNDKVPMYSLYLTVVDSLKFYTINMSVEKTMDYKTKICELESIIKTLKINKKTVGNNL